MEPIASPPAHQPAFNPPSPILVAATLERLRGLQIPGEPDVVQRVVRLFLEGTPELVAAIHSGIDMEDLGAVYRAAQTLAIAAEEVGAQRLCEAGRKLQHRCQNAHPTFDDLISDFQTTYAITVEALSEVHAS